MQKIYFFVLVAFTVFTVYSCKSDDKAKEQTETEITETQTKPDSTAASTTPAIKDNFKISAVNVAPDDKDILRRVRVLYVNSKGGALAAAYGYRADNKGVVVIEKSGAAPVTLKQTGGTDENASYSNGTTTWMVNGGEAVLKEGNTETAYKAQR